MLGEMFEVVRTAEVALPATHTVFLIISLSLCLLLRYCQLGLTIAYAYFLYVGWHSCIAELLGRPPEYGVFATAYVLLGAAVLFLSIVRMARSSD